MFLFALWEYWEALVLGLVPHGCFIQDISTLLGRLRAELPCWPGWPVSCVQDKRLHLQSRHTILEIQVTGSWSVLVVEQHISFATPGQVPGAGW